MRMQQWWNDTGRKTEVLEETRPGATLSTSDSAWTGLRSNPGLYNAKMMTA
jgi:hypothetical protein